MLFWNELDIYIKNNTFDMEDYHNSQKVINSYLKNDPKFPWEELSLNMQEMLIDFESTSDYIGLTPPNAREFGYAGYV